MVVNSTWLNRGPLRIQQDAVLRPGNIPVTHRRKQTLFHSWQTMGKPLDPPSIFTCADHKGKSTRHMAFGVKTTRRPQLNILAERHHEVKIISMHKSNIFCEKKWNAKNSENIFSLKHLLLAGIQLLLQLSSFGLQNDLQFRYLCTRSTKKCNGSKIPIPIYWVRCVMWCLHSNNLQ